MENNNIKKSLVIGAAGFVGGYLAKHLRDDLHRDTILTKLPSEEINLDGFSVYDLDILQLYNVRAILDQIRPDEIYHLAAQSSVSVSWKNPRLTAEVNISGCIDLLEAVRSIENYSPKILLIGSGEEYGILPKGVSLVSEDTPVNPINPYAVTKAAQNMIGRLYAKSYGMRIVMVRAFNHIGKGQSVNFAAADFCRQTAEIIAGRRENVIKAGNLSAKRDFTDVRDIVRAYGLLAEKGVDGETYNVGSGKSISIEELLCKIISLSGKSIKREIDPDKLRPSDVPEIRADISKLKKDTGWQPIIPLEQTLTEILMYELGEILNGKRRV